MNIEELIETLPYSDDVKKEVLTLCNKPIEETEYWKNLPIRTKVHYLLEKYPEEILKKMRILRTERVELPDIRFSVKPNLCGDFCAKAIHYNSPNTTLTLESGEKALVRPSYSESIRVKWVNNKTKEQGDYGLNSLSWNARFLEEISRELDKIIENRFTYPKIIEVFNQTVVITHPWLLNAQLPNGETLDIVYRLRNDGKFNRSERVLAAQWNSALSMKQVIDENERNEDICKLLRAELMWNNGENSPLNWKDSKDIENYWIIQRLVRISRQNRKYKIINSDTRENIGEFVPRYGELGVFMLDEILKFNPDFKYFADNNINCAIIKDFTGTITIKKDVFEFEGSKHDGFKIIGKGNTNFESSFIVQFGVHPFMGGGVDWDICE